MSLSYFYIAQLEEGQRTIELDEDTSYHIVQVLRMPAGEMIQLTNGKGAIATARIIEGHKKHCVVSIDKMSVEPAPTRSLAIAISLVKNTSRFEWFLEKATEIGINVIIPLLCERTIRDKFRFDRMKGICTSAMLQSQQCWLPDLHQPIAFDLLFRQQEMQDIPQKFIAHCEEGHKQMLDHHFMANKSSQLICIGPEGDFSPAEIELALVNKCIPVSLGNTRLRTETAGVVAATLMKLA